jgi:trk system potassium uptake protein TrkA
VYILIVGCGSFGSEMADTLSQDGHDVVVIDRNELSFRLLPAGFNGMTQRGNGIDEEMLREAGIERADALLALTSSDSVNLMAAQIAKSVFGVERVMARLYDHSRIEIAQAKGIEALCLTDIGVVQARYALRLGGVLRMLSLGAGEIELISLNAPKSLSGRRIEEFELKGKFHIAALLRQGRAILARASDALQEGDTLYCLVRVDLKDAVPEIFGIAQEEF